MRRRDTGPARAMSHTTEGRPLALRTKRAVAVSLVFALGGFLLLLASSYFQQAAHALRRAQPYLEFHGVLETSSYAHLLRRGAPAFIGLNWGILLLAYGAALRGALRGRDRPGRIRASASIVASILAVALFEWFIVVAQIVTGV